MAYDIFYASKHVVRTDDWQQFRSRYPTAQKIDNVKSYNDIKNKSFTKLFWVVWDDITIADQFAFDYQVPDWDQDFTHVWLNGTTYDGVVLFSKNSNLTQKEFDNRFYVNKKEISVVASTPRNFEIFNIHSYADYCLAVRTSTTDMFWAVWNDIIIDNNFAFDYHVATYDTFHRNITHVFKNGDFFDGVCLFSKNKPITKREFDHRFFIDKKEVEINASLPRQYDKFVIDNYQDYLIAKEKTTTDLFWIIPKEVEILNSFNFDLYFTHHNSIERNLNHVFKHIVKNQETYNGVALVPRSADLSKKEIEYRYLIEKKEYNIVASKLKLYDIIFISYAESNADENFEKLQNRFPSAKRVHGVKGIHQAHIAAAKLSTTAMFWVVDGDAIVVDEFIFDYEVSVHETDVVHVCLSRNPINDLTYGYGGVKLLPKHLTERMELTSVDMTMSISKKFKVINQVSNITAFNIDPFNTWKSAFRECVKLASRPIDAGYQEETEDRLITWCNIGADKLYGEHCISGARAGRQYGLDNITNPEALVKINDFEWLQKQFDQLFPMGKTS